MKFVRRHRVSLVLLALVGVVAALVAFRLREQQARARAARSRWVSSSRNAARSR